MTTKRRLKIGLIGYDFMGRAHSNAWRQAPRFFDLPAEIELNTICGRNRAAVKSAASKLGWQNFKTDWRNVVTDPEIDVIDICTPNDLHCEIAIAAARAGRAILCEKPLARTVAEAKQMVAAVTRARVPHMVCHNYRRVPAIALAKQMIEAGEIGDRIFHFRARYAQDWIVDPNFPLVWRLQSDKAGSGALGDIFSHIVDLGRYLVGEFREVSAVTETFIKKRPSGIGFQPMKSGKRRQDGEDTPTNVTVDDAVTMIGQFVNGAMASLEATRFAPGRENALTFEINGSQGSLVFDLEDLNHLRFFSRRDPAGRRGFRDILVTEPTHPYIKSWWPTGHIIGWEHTFTHTIADFVSAIVHKRKSEPTFTDALKTQQVLNAVMLSARSHRSVDVGRCH